MIVRASTICRVGHLAAACYLVGAGSSSSSSTGVWVMRHSAHSWTRAYPRGTTAFASGVAPSPAGRSIAHHDIREPAGPRLRRAYSCRRAAAAAGGGGAGVAAKARDRAASKIPTTTATTGGQGHDDDDDDLNEQVKKAIAGLPRRPRCAVVGGGFAGLATAYHLAAFGSDVTVFDPHEVGTGGASAVAAGLLHPLTSRGKLIWKGEEGFAAARELIEVANDQIGEAGAGQGGSGQACGCISTDRVYRPLMDERHYAMFSKAAKELPEWVEELSREEYLKAVPGSDSQCLGGVRIRGALAVDAPLYLKGLWAACRRAVSSIPNVEGQRAPAEGATWVRQRVDDVHSLAASGEFNAVVACVGAGVKILAGVQEVVSLRLVRGQTLLYENVTRTQQQQQPQPPRDTATAGAPLAGTRAAASADSRGPLLTSAVLCGQYVVPGTVVGEGRVKSKLLCGSTQEPVLPADVDKPADLAKALRQLGPKISKFFPALQGMEPVGVSAGVRVIQDRNSHGRIPIAGRLPFSERGWVIAALGARGLIHHAYVGRLTAACMLLNSDDALPPQLVSPLEDLGGDSNPDL